MVKFGEIKIGENGFVGSRAVVMPGVVLENEANVGALSLVMKEKIVRSRKYLLERLMRIADIDNEKLLLKFRNRVNRVGIKMPTIEVRFEHMKIKAEVHVGKRASPTLTNYILDMVEAPLNYILRRRRQQVNILKNVSGIIKPGRMTLLLGPPSSGKTLLLPLAGKLDPKLKFSGKVTYNGHEMNEFVPQRTAAYVSQNDLHIGELTVRETLEFSARFQGVGLRYDMLEEAIATGGQKSNFVIDYYLKILGLETCADTVVGNAMLRGVSGGQRKRVMTGEMLVSCVLKENLWQTFYKK
ncbi:transcription factor [Trifolium repens]|nr:transcription factor [Trifolium repens]